MEPLTIWKMRDSKQMFVLVGIATLYDSEGMSREVIAVFHPESQVHDLSAMKLRDFRKLFEEWRAKNASKNQGSKMDRSK